MRHTRLSAAFHIIIKPFPIQASPLCNCHCVIGSRTRELPRLRSLQCGSISDRRQISEISVNARSRTWRKPLTRYLMYRQPASTQPAQSSPIIDVLEHVARKVEGRNEKLLGERRANVAKSSDTELAPGTNRPRLPMFQGGDVRYGRIPAKAFKLCRHSRPILGCTSVDGIVFVRFR